MSMARSISRFGTRLLRHYLAAGVLAFELLWGPAPPQPRWLHHGHLELWLSDPRLDENGWHAGELILTPGQRLVLTLPDDAPQPVQLWTN